MEIEDFGKACKYLLKNVVSANKGGICSDSPDGSGPISARVGTRAPDTFVVIVRDLLLLFGVLKN